MDFIDKIQALAVRIPKQLEFCTTEEATKNALVLPFISALGYDIFNPTEVVPEFTADVGTKKGEKVDYAIMQAGDPIILFECKWVGVDLSDTHMSQLFRYFAAVPKVRFGILTNGVIYRFYSDLDSPNRIDDKPFFEFNMLDFQDRHVEELKKFTKSTFDLNQILDNARELKYTAAIQRMITQEFEQPTDDFVRFFASRVYSGRVTQTVLKQFDEIVRKALRRYLSDYYMDRLKSAMESSDRIVSQPPSQETGSDIPLDAEESDILGNTENGIVTTEDELEAFYAVKSILRGVVDVRRICLRDVKTYCSVLLDDNNRRPVCRFHFNNEQKYLGLFDGDKKDERVVIDRIDDIYKYAERIIAAASVYAPVAVKVSSAATSVAPIAVQSAKPQKSTGQRIRYTGTKPSAFVFQGHRYEVNSWRDAMFGIFEAVRKQNPKRFEEVAVTLVGRKRPYITPDQTLLRSAALIPDTGLYAETNLDADSIASLCFDLVKRMGFPTTDLYFEVG
ncbi:MAG: type I restriction enzyme HsdR N-terminal domain-containing protein [Caldilineales bacterium]|nr:type I restriction enzyme HsdR N-terminal domain-containing protein [Caldilineales bacterium]